MASDGASTSYAPPPPSVPPPPLSSNPSLAPPLPSPPSHTTKHKCSPPSFRYASSFTFSCRSSFHPPPPHSRTCFHYCRPPPPRSRTRFHYYRPAPPPYPYSLPPVYRTQCCFHEYFHHFPSLHAPANSSFWRARFYARSSPSYFSSPPTAVPSSSQPMDIDSSPSPLTPSSADTPVIYPLPMAHPSPIAMVSPSISPSSASILGPPLPDLPKLRPSPLH